MAEQNKNNPGNTGTANPNKPTQQDRPGEQPGTQRQGAERTQMGANTPDKGTAPNAGNTDRKDDRAEERQPGTQRQGAERTQMGEATGNTPHAQERNAGEQGRSANEDDDTTNPNQQRG